MKVTLLSGSRGGVFSFTENLAWRLVQKHHMLEIFLISKTEESKNASVSRSLHLNYLTISNFVPNLRTIISFLLYDRSDIVHINFASFGPLAVFKRLVFKTPFILTLHGLPQPWIESSWADKVRYTIENLLLPFVALRASAIVTVSNFVKTGLKTRYGFDSELIYHGIDVDRLEIKDRETCRRQLGYNRTDSIVLSVGRLHPSKDPLTLIRAFDEARVPNSHLVLVGTGGLLKKVSDVVEQSNLSKKVRMIEQLDKEALRLYYSAADVFVLPSFNEAFGLVLLEAMASGVPIIASDSGACPEVVGDAGILFKQGDFHALAERINKLLRDKELQIGLSNAGLTRVRKFFSLKDETDRYLDIYERIVRSRSNRSVQ